MHYFEVLSEEQLLSSVALWSKAEQDTDSLVYLLDERIPFMHSGNGLDEWLPVWNYWRRLPQRGRLPFVTFYARLTPAGRKEIATLFWAGFRDQGKPILFSVPAISVKRKENGSGTITYVRGEIRRELLVENEKAEEWLKELRAWALAEIMEGERVLALGLNRRHDTIMNSLSLIPEFRGGLYWVEEEHKMSVPAFHILNRPGGYLIEPQHGGEWELYEKLLSPERLPQKKEPVAVTPAIIEETPKATPVAEPVVTEPVVKQEVPVQEPIQAPSVVENTPKLEETPLPVEKVKEEIEPVAAVEKKEEAVTGATPQPVQTSVSIAGMGSGFDTVSFSLPSSTEESATPPAPVEPKKVEEIPVVKPEEEKKTPPVRNAVNSAEPVSFAFLPPARTDVKSAIPVRKEEPQAVVPPKEEQKPVTSAPVESSFDTVSFSLKPPVVEKEEARPASPSKNAIAFEEPATVEISSDSTEALQYEEPVEPPRPIKKTIEPVTFKPRPAAKQNPEPVIEKAPQPLPAKPETPPALDDSALVSKLYEEGMALARQGRHEEAARKLSAIAEFEAATLEQRSSSLYNRGVMHALRGEIDAAIQDFSELVSLKGTSTEWWEKGRYNRGIAYAQKEMLEESNADFSALIERGGVSPQALVSSYYYRGLNNADLKKNTEAIADFSYMVNYQGIPKEARADALFNRALLYQKGERLEDAIRDYNEFLAIGSNTPKQERTALFNRGNAWLTLGDYDQAVQDFTKVINLPDISLDHKAAALNNRAMAKIELWQKEEALADFHEVMSYPSQSEMIVSLKNVIEEVLAELKDK